MTSTPTIPAELASVAAEAWAMLSRADDPMPVYAALDYVRERGECEDVEAVRRALYGAAADDLEGAMPGAPTMDMWSISAPDQVGQIRVGQFFGHTVEYMRADTKKFLQSEWTREWFWWFDRADAALALCRAIAATGETT